MTRNNVTLWATRSQLQIVAGTRRRVLALGFLHTNNNDDNGNRLRVFHSFIITNPESISLDTHQALPSVSFEYIQ
jgi:hypothetical protein